jgi:MtN3 and saliva related transmembrane protein
MIEIVGWLGAILFAFCALPQVIKVYKTKQTEDLSMSFLQMWLWGEVFSFIYVMNNETTQWPLITNYIFNILLVLYLVWAKIKYDWFKINSMKG